MSAGSAVLHQRCLSLAGDWTLEHYAQLSQRSRELAPLPAELTFSCAQLGRLDTAGAALLVEWLGPHAAALQAQLPAHQQTLLALLQTLPNDAPAAPRRPAAWPLRALADLGRQVEDVGRECVALLGFLGLSLQTLAQVLPHPRRWRLTSIVAHLQQSAFEALPIVALLTFMVGAVIAFLGATVLSSFGATIYAVNLVAFAFLREFGVLLAAILVAGRSASAFAAQIGSMRANEELDALRTLGLSPMELLVLPRMLALLIALPLLTLVSMFSGLLGGLAVCALSLDIPPQRFLMLLQDTELRHFLAGLAKAPLFAVLVALIGCLEGLRVGGSAQSVGEHTTAAVVKSIFAVILLDALVALFYMEVGW